MFKDNYHQLINLDQGPLHYFSVLGRAIFTAQCFEATCKAISAYYDFHKYLINNDKLPINDPSFLAMSDEFNQKFVLNRFKEKFLDKKIIRRTEKIDIVDIFIKAQQSRNRLAHNIAATIDNNLDCELDDRINQIVICVKDIALADYFFSSILQRINKQDDILLTEDEYINGIVIWVTEATFEE